MASGGKHRAKGVCNGFDWDDTALIEAYDRAMNQVKEKCEGVSGTSKRNSSKEQKQRINKWKVDDFCRSIYKEDGSSYEAQIVSINEEEETCTVLFLGYENEEEVELGLLTRSHGKLARKKQISESKKSSDYQNKSFNEDSTSVYSDCNSTSSEKKRRNNRNTSKNRTHQSSIYSQRNASLSQNFPVPPTCPPFPCGPQFSCSAGPQMNMPPPPMPFFPMKEVTNENSLASMLMSWYMAGYHTGVHQGIQIGQRDAHSSSNRCSHSCNHDRVY